MGKEKLLFFDIDGTLVGFDGKVPDSAWEALNLARANGHQLFLCSGRTRHQICKSLLDFGFDGIVASTGGYVEYQGELLYHQVFGKERMKSILDCFGDTGAGLIFEMKESCACTPSSKQQFEGIYQDKVDIADLKELEAFRNLIVDDDYSSFPDKYFETEGIVYCYSPYPTEEVARRLPENLHVDLASFKDPEPYSGEITLASANKQTGIQKVLDYLGKDREDVIAFGDGANDIQMLDFAGTAVAMGNAGKETRGHADFVTDSVNADGIYKAIRSLKLMKN